MIRLSREIEALARQLAAAQGTSLGHAVASTIEQAGRATGIVRSRRRQTVQAMLAVGAKIAAMPLLDMRSSRQIMDDINTG